MHFFHLPNLVSFLRIALVPAIAVLLTFQRPTDEIGYHPMVGLLSALLFVLAGVSDLFDGYLARKMNLTSTFGKFIDPLADKLIHMTVLVLLIPLGEIPAWMAVCLLARELTITALRGIAAAEGMILAADVWGKKKTALLNVSLTCFLLPPVFLGLSTRAIGWPVLILAFIVSIGSGLNYLKTFFSYAQKKNF